jgi:hypothetical protein
MDEAEVFAELALLDGREAEALVEADGAGVAGQRVDQNGLHRGIGEAEVDRPAHHAGAVAAAQAGRFADPDVDGAQVGRHGTLPPRLRRSSASPSGAAAHRLARKDPGGRRP